MNLRNADEMKVTWSQVHLLSPWLPDFEDLKSLTNRMTGFIVNHLILGYRCIFQMDDLRLPKRSVARAAILWLGTSWHWGLGHPRTTSHLRVSWNPVPKLRRLCDLQSTGIQWSWYVLILIWILNIIIEWYLDWVCDWVDYFLMFLLDLDLTLPGIHAGWCEEKIRSLPDCSECRTLPRRDASSCLVAVLKMAACQSHWQILELSSAALLTHWQPRWIICLPRCPSWHQLCKLAGTMATRWTQLEQHVMVRKDGNMKEYDMNTYYHISHEKYSPSLSKVRECAFDGLLLPMLAGLQCRCQAFLQHCSGAHKGAQMDSPLDLQHSVPGKRYSSSFLNIVEAWEPANSNACRMRSLVLTCRGSWNLHWKLKQASSLQPDCSGTCSSGLKRMRRCNGFAKLHRSDDNTLPFWLALRCIICLAVPTSKQSWRNVRIESLICTPEMHRRYSKRWVMGADHWFKICVWAVRQQMSTITEAVPHCLWSRLISCTPAGCHRSNFLDWA